jgi:hypothetical protein
MGLAGDSGTQNRAATNYQVANGSARLDIAKPGAEGASMQLEVVNPNHTSESDASELERACARARAALAAIGAGDAVVVAPGLWASVVSDASRWRDAQPSAASDSKPPHLWTVRQLAKQAGISEKAARALARKLNVVCVAPSHCCGCRGGTRGCDLRFLAETASSWLSQRRSKRDAR